jgi:hypothetical protein
VGVAPAPGSEAGPRTGAGARLGLCRKNLWARTAGLAFLFLISILSGVLVALASRLIWHVSVGPGMMFSFAGVTLGLTVAAVLMTMNTIFLVPVTLAMVAVAVICIVLGMGTVSRRFAMPKSATFDGQVVARWQQRDHDSEGGDGIVRRTAIDDGVRAWIFAEPHVYAMVAVGDLVQVTFSPRTGQLQRLTVTAARLRAERGSGPGSPGRSAPTSGARPGAPPGRRNRSRPPGHATPSGRDSPGAGRCRTR